MRESRTGLLKPTGAYDAAKLHNSRHYDFYWGHTDIVFSLNLSVDGCSSIQNKKKDLPRKT